MASEASWTAAYVTLNLSKRVKRAKTLLITERSLNTMRFWGARKGYYVTGPRFVWKLVGRVCRIGHARGLGVGRALTRPARRPAPRVTHPRPRCDPTRLTFVQLEARLYRRQLVTYSSSVYCLVGKTMNHKDLWSCNEDPGIISFRRSIWPFNQLVAGPFGSRVSLI